MSTQTSERSTVKEIARAYLFTGESDQRRKAAVEEIIHVLIDADSEIFDLEVVDGDSASAADILAAVCTAPFASERKVVVVERVDRLEQEDQERIARFLSKLTPKSCLVMLMAEESSPRAKQKSRAKEKKTEKDDGTADKRKKGLNPDLKKSVKAHGKIVTFARLKAAQLEQIAAAEAKKQGKQIERRALLLLSRSVGENAAVLQREVEKLAVHAGDRNTITLEDVESVACRSPEDQVFQLMDAIGARRSDQAIRLLDNTLASSAKPENEVQRILALFGRHFRLLYQLEFLKSAGVKRLYSVPDELQALLMKELNVLSLPDWQRRKLLAQTNFFSLEQLQHCLKRVLACELTTKGLGDETSSRRLSLEMLVVRLCDRK